ncbi:21835_t:CDS:2, partial [Dentiscutata erythropus]
EASAIVRSRSLNSSLNVILIRFYPKNTIQELSLPEFEDKDVVLTTGNFCIVENPPESKQTSDAKKPHPPPNRILEPLLAQECLT